MKHKFYIKGKKSGIVGSAISNFWSYVLFVFVVIIFFVFFSIQEREVRENVIGSAESEANMDIVALNYLRTPIGPEIGGMAITDNRNFADFIQELIIKELIAPTDPIELWGAIDEAFQENLIGFDINNLDSRLMIFLDDGGCLYDSHNEECQDTLYFKIPEGTIFLPVPIEPNDIKIIKVVFSIEQQIK